MDLKPENVAFTDDYDLALIDFGITVKASEPRSSYQGTSIYRAPEVDLCKTLRVNYSPKVADIYSLGVCFFNIMFQALTTNTNNAD